MADALGTPAAASQVPSIPSPVARGAIASAVQSKERELELMEAELGAILRGHSYDVSGVAPETAKAVDQRFGALFCELAQVLSARDARASVIDAATEADAVEAELAAAQAELAGHLEHLERVRADKELQLIRQREAQARVDSHMREVAVVSSRLSTSSGNRMSWTPSYGRMSHLSGGRPTAHSVG